jgi:hypothetical protein
MVGALDLSEAARIALLQEMMRDAKRNERGGLLVCLVGVVVSVAGFSTIPYAGNSLNLGIVGLLVAALGFTVYLHYARLYSRFVGQLAKIALRVRCRVHNAGRFFQKANLASVLSAGPLSNLKARYNKSF